MPTPEVKNLGQFIHFLSFGLFLVCLLLIFGGVEVACRAAINIPDNPRQRHGLFQSDHRGQHQEMYPPNYHQELGEKYVSKLVEEVFRSPGSS